MNFNQIIERIKITTGSKNDKDIAQILGLSASDFSNRKKRGTLTQNIIDWAINENVNLNWVLTGTGEMSSDQPATGSASQVDNIGSISNLQLMQNLIQWVEEGCQEHGVKIKPAAKAKLLIKLYKIFSKENPEVQRDEVVRHLRLVA